MKDFKHFTDINQGRILKNILREITADKVWVKSGSEVPRLETVFRPQLKIMNQGDLVIPAWSLCALFYAIPEGIPFERNKLTKEITPYRPCYVREDEDDYEQLWYQFTFQGGDFQNGFVNFNCKLVEEKSKNVLFSCSAENPIDAIVEFLILASENGVQF